MKKKGERGRRENKEKKGRKCEIGLPFYYHVGFVFLREYFHEESGQDMLWLVWEREE